MRRYESLDTAFWTDHDFDDWTADALLLYAYLLLNMHSHGLSGVYELSERTLRQETRLSPKRLERAWEHVKAKVYRKGPWVWIRAKAGRTVHTALHVKGLCSYLRHVPMEIRKQFVDRYLHIVSLNGEGVPIPSPSYPQGVHVTDTVTDTEKDKNPPSPLAKIPAQASDAYQKVFGAIGDAERFATVTGAWKPGTMVATLKALGAKKVKEMHGWGESRRLSYLRAAGDRVDNEPEPESRRDAIGRAVKEGSRG